MLSPEIDPDDELLMHSCATLPNKCKKYWKKRYDLFSKFDDGVYLTAELWYSVTPELTARVIARIIKKLLPECRSVLDVCCGGGGNTIQFARVFPQVVGVDVNSTNVMCSRHNCGVYGVQHKTWFVTGDWLELSQTSDWIPAECGGPSHKFDFVFCSPPWGGPGYKYKDVFDLDAMTPFNLRQLCVSISRYTDNFGLFLPRNLDFDHIKSVTRELFGGKFRTRVVCIWQNGRPLGIMAVFGPSYKISI